MLEELAKDDQAALELLQKARERREIDITEAAKRARSADDRRERDATNAGILAQEAIRFHGYMMKLNRKLSVSNLLGRSSVKVERGEIRHWPTSKFGNNLYKVETPLLLTTPPELIDVSTIIDGYKFSTDHHQKGQKGNATVAISRVLQDINTGESVNSAYEYIIHVYGEESGHPYALISGAAAGASVGEIKDYDDPRYEEPIGLLRLANEELSAHK